MAGARNGDQEAEHSTGLGRRIIDFFFGDGTRAAITAAVIAILSIATAIVIAVVDNGGSVAAPGAPGQVVEDPDNLVEEIAARDFWVGDVGTFGAANDGSMNGTPADLEFSYDLTPTSVDQLVTDAASEYNSNRATLLVGRVESSRAFDYDFAEQRGGLYELDSETRLIGVSGENDVYVASPAGTFLTGEVMIVLGELAAWGPSRSPEGKRMQTAYFVADQEGGDASSYSEISFSDFGRAVRHSAQQAIRAKLP